jgi:HEAT repeat protein
LESPHPDTPPERIDDLLAEIARVHHWFGLYAPGHPFLSGKIRALRDALASRASMEPSGILLLGFVNDRALYRGRDVVGEPPLISGFTKTLSRLHVATLGIGADVTVDGLSEFFRRLRGLWTAPPGGSGEERLHRERIPGIHLSPVDYREVLSRGVVAMEAPPPSGAGKGRRQDAPGRKFAPPFSEDAIRWRGQAVLVELLISEKRDLDFLDLLAEIAEAIPRMIDERDFELLNRVLSALLDISESGTPTHGAAAGDVLRSVDFLRIVDAVLARPGTLEGENGGAALLSKQGSFAAEALLRKLETEEESGRRKTLLSLILRLGEKAVPSILSRVEGQSWFFLRNLCFLLGEIGAFAGVPALLGLLSAKEPKVRREAVQALGKIGSPDPDVVAALGRTLLHEPILSSSVEDPIRIDAAIALYRIGGTEAISLLHVGKSSKKKAVREQCEALLRTEGTG